MYFKPGEIFRMFFKLYNEENTNLEIYLEDFKQFSDLIEIVFKKYLNLIFVKSSTDL